MPLHTNHLRLQKNEAAAIALALALALLTCLVPNIRAFAAPNGDLGVTFVYISSNSTEVSNEQYVVVGFDTPVNDAQLILHDATSGQDLTLTPTTIDEAGAALFTVSSDHPAELALSAVRYKSGADNEGWTEQILDSPQRSQTGVIRVEEISDGESIASEAFAIDESGNVNPVLDDGMAASITEGRTTAGDTNGDGVFTIVLDPGHGGSDPGALGFGLRESDLTLSIGKYCQQTLSQYAKTKVYMTRTSDTFVDLKPRADFAKSVGADLFVSLHINSSPASSANGAEIWVPSPGTWFPAFNGIGENLAREMLSKLKALGLVDRDTVWDNYEVNGEKKYYPDGSWADSLSVIRNCREAGIMAILVEHGFISNQSDAKFLSSEANLKKLGEADAQGIVDYYGLKLPQPLHGFADVFDDTPHSGEIGWMAASGISEGFSDGTFRGLTQVARQDLAAFLYRLAGSPEYSPTQEDRSRFSDVNTATPHAKEIWWLASNDITSGFPDGTFRGTSTVARQDMAALLRRFTARFLDPSAATYHPGSSDMAAFLDVSRSTPHAEDIWWLASEEISSGYSDKTFRGTSAVARQDMAAFLWRASNLPSYRASAEDKESFTDVNEGTSHAQDIWWLAAKRISTGYPDGTFKGQDTVVRQDMAAFLYRLAGSPAYTPSQADKKQFVDVTEKTPHAREIWWMVSIGLTQGYGDGTFRPQNAVTRADMAAFMHRFYNAFSQHDQFRNWTPSSKAKQRFLDVNSVTNKCEDIWWLGATGISLGFADGRFDPTGSVVRQDMAAFLHRLDSRANRPTGAQLYSIMGESSASAKQMVAYFTSVNAKYPESAYESKGAPTIDAFAQIIVEEAEAEGVKAEIVFCQAMKETGWLRFGGSVKPDQCNFAGLGATGGSVSGAVFPDVRTGIRAQVQHLKAYASTEPLVNKCVDPRFSYVKRGSATTLASLNGKWAVPGNHYGEDVYEMIQNLATN